MAIYVGDVRVRPRGMSVIRVGDVTVWAPPAETAPTVSITTGTGYNGSVYTSTVAGQWYADDVAILGATGTTWTMTLAYEGAAIRCGESNPIELWMPADEISLIEYIDIRDASTLTLNAGGDRAVTIRNKVNNAARTEAFESAFYTTADDTGMPVVEGSGGGRPIGPLAFTGPSLFGLVVGRLSDPVIAYARLVSLGNDNGDNDWNDAKRVALIKRDNSNQRFDTERGNGSRARVDITSPTATAIIDVQHTPTRAIISENGRRGSGSTYASLGNFEFSAIGLFGATNFGDKGKGQLSLVLLFGAEVSADTRAKVQGFAAHAFGLVGVLPANHRYKTVAPRASDPVIIRQSLVGDLVPAVLDAGADDPVALGLNFAVETAGKVRGVRFYKSAANVGVHTGRLWTEAGGLLASVVFVGETASGWQEQEFDVPVDVVPGVDYRISCHCTTGHYSFTSDFFDPDINIPVQNGDVYANRGSYGYGGATAFPNTTSLTNYGVDLIYEAN